MNDLMQRLLEKLKDEHFILETPVSADEINDFKTRLKLNLPEDFKNLRYLYNGISGPFGENLVWPIKKILEENLAFQSNEDFQELYMSFENLLFIGDQVNGDLFAYVILNNEISRSDIFIWEHETDSRIWYSSNLEEYLERRMKDD